MSNPKDWRGKGRTEKPNSRQKRNKFYIDAHPTCHRCKEAASEEAHHILSKKHPLRNDWRFMQALCVPCHVTLHQHLKTSFNQRQRAL